MDHQAIPNTKNLVDVQSSQDARNIAIQKVGIKSVKYPVQILTPKGVMSSVANVDMYVALPAHVRGTHMSRLLETLADNTAPMSVTQAKTLMRNMLHRLEATSGDITLNMPYFIEKTAPISGIKSLMDYELGFEIIAHSVDNIDVYMHMLVPVKSLCPCSKKISIYGAHNQRSHIKVKALVVNDVFADELIPIIEAQASSEIWALLKREDEKFITEKAYENPKFVEDLVRDVALAMNGLPNVLAYELSAENFESIHNHSAYAYIAHDKRTHN